MSGRGPVSCGQTDSSNTPGNRQQYNQIPGNLKPLDPKTLNLDLPFLENIHLCNSCTCRSQGIIFINVMLLVYMTVLQNADFA